MDLKAYLAGAAGGIASGGAGMLVYDHIAGSVLCALCFAGPLRVAYGIAKRAVIFRAEPERSSNA